jgi:hypothetical protein
MMGHRSWDTRIQNGTAVWQSQIKSTEQNSSYQGLGKIGEILVKGYQISVLRGIWSKDLLYYIVIIINNNGLNP